MALHDMLINLFMVSEIETHSHFLHALVKNVILRTSWSLFSISGCTPFLKDWLCSVKMFPPKMNLSQSVKEPVFSGKVMIDLS